AQPREIPLAPLTWGLADHAVPDRETAGHQHSSIPRDIAQVQIARDAFHQPEPTRQVHGKKRCGMVGRRLREPDLVTSWGPREAREEEPVKSTNQPLGSGRIHRPDRRHIEIIALSERKATAVRRRSHRNDRRARFRLEENTTYRSFQVAGARAGLADNGQLAAVGRPVRKTDSLGYFSGRPAGPRRSGQGVCAEEGHGPWDRLAPE